MGTSYTKVTPVLKPEVSPSDVLKDLFFYGRSKNSLPVFKYLLSSKLSDYCNTDGLRLNNFKLKPFYSYLTHQALAATFEDRSAQLRFSNLDYPLYSNFSLKRRITTRLDRRDFEPNVLFIYSKVLGDFVEHITGRRSLMNLNPSIEKGLTFTDLAKLSL